MSRGPLPALCVISVQFAPRGQIELSFDIGCQLSSMQLRRRRRAVHGFTGRGPFLRRAYFSVL